MDCVTAEWVEVWLRGRDKKALLAFGNPRQLVMGFADTHTCERVFFRTSEARKDPYLYYLYGKLMKKQTKNPLGGMLQGWLHVISAD